LPVDVADVVAVKVVDETRASSSPSSLESGRHKKRQMRRGQAHVGRVVACEMSGEVRIRDVDVTLSSNPPIITQSTFNQSKEQEAYA
jgi:hypothetical protein